MLNVTRIDRGTDVQRDRKTLRKKPTRLKLTYVGINIGENLNNLPIQTGIVTRHLATRSKNVGDFLYDKYRVIHKTRSDSKVMRLVPKKSFILFLHQLQCGRLQSTSLVPAHTFSSVAAIVCSIPGTQLEECRLRPALQTYGCLLLTQNGVFHCQFCFLE